MFAQSLKSLLSKPVITKKDNNKATQKQEKKPTKTPVISKQQKSKEKKPESKANQKNQTPKKVPEKPVDPKVCDWSLNELLVLALRGSVINVTCFSSTWYYRISEWFFIQNRFSNFEMSMFVQLTLHVIFFSNGRALAMAIAIVPTIWNWTIQNLDFFVRISNGFWQMAAICLDLKWLGFRISDPFSKSRPFATQPLLDHLKSWLDQISDPHCIVMQIETVKKSHFYIQSFSHSHLNIGQLCLIQWRLEYLTCSEFQW